MVIENYVIDNRLSSNNYLIFQYVKELISCEISADVQIVNL